MTSRDFCYWLQGFFELAEAGNLSAKKTAAIKAHLDMVFAHEIDPSMGTAEHREELQEIHDRKPGSEEKERRLEDLAKAVARVRGGSSDLKLMC